MDHCCDLCHCFDFCKVGQKMSTKQDSSHYHHIFITMWWAYQSFDFTKMISEIDLQKFVISSNSDKKVMEMWWTKLNLVASEEFAITFPSHFHDNWIELYIPYYFSKLMSIPLWQKCDGKVTIVWLLVLKNNMVCTTPSNHH